MTLEQCLNLDVNKYNTLARLMRINEARDTLRDFNISIYPKLKDDARNNLHRKYSKVAYPASFEIKNVVRLGDLKKVING
tara:strand:- start:2389 stop:2628 length:240 start_codon:yes stop_codon:yes gene_type:complete